MIASRVKRNIPFLSVRAFYYYYYYYYYHYNYEHTLLIVLKLTCTLTELGIHVYTRGSVFRLEIISRHSDVVIRGVKVC